MSNFVKIRGFDPKHFGKEVGEVEDFRPEM